jgi:hypothetical protein
VLAGSRSAELIALPADEQRRDAPLDYPRRRGSPPPRWPLRLGDGRSPPVRSGADMLQLGAGGLRLSAAHEREEKGRSNSVHGDG